LIQRRSVDEVWRSRDVRVFVFLGTVAVCMVVLAIAVRGILGPLIMAGVLALIMNPAVNAAERRRVPRAVTVLAIYAGVAGVLAASVYYLAPLIRQQFVALVAQGPAIAGYLQDLVEQGHVVSVLGMPIDMRQIYAEAVKNLPGLVAGQFPSVVQNVFMLLNWLFQALLALLIAFFLVKDSRSIRRFFESLVPAGFRTDARTLGVEVYWMLGAYMRGQVFVCALVGAVTGIALSLVGIPYSLALGVIAGVTAFIPFLGPFVGALPAVAVAAFISQDTGKVLFVLAIFFVVSNVIYNFVSPKVFGDAVHLSPMLVIIAFVVGGYLGGILGLFIAVPVAAIIRILFLYVHERVYA
jgi:predicted PurR-regulated permease PerM